MKKPGAVAAALIPLAALTACAPGDDGRTTLTFAVADQTLSPATASYATVPETMGYYAEEGLNVEMQPVNSAVAAIQAVANQQATCTYGSTANAATAIAEDPGLAIVGTVNGNIFRTVAPADAGIETMADLEGKTVGVNRRGGISDYLVMGGLESEGRTAGDDLLLAVGWGAQAAEALRNGDVDVYSGYDSSNLIISRLLGEELVTVESETDALTGTSALVCRDDDVENRPEAIAGLYRAFFKGVVFSEVNPRAAIAMHWENFPASQLAGAEESDLDTAAEILTARMETTGGHGSAGVYGLQKDEDLQHTLDVYRDYGVIDVPADVASVDALTDYSLVERYNDFDADEVRKDAREWDG